MIRRINRDQLLTYVNTLNPTAKNLFVVANDMALYSDLDTLSEEFQIATVVMKVFEERAEAYWKERE